MISNLCRIVEFLKILKNVGFSYIYIMHELEPVSCRPKFHDVVNVWILEHFIVTDSGNAMYW
jgi:hypothetical protein